MYDEALVSRRGNTLNSVLVGMLAEEGHAGDFNYSMN
jgi:hypothetical protein